MNTPIHQSVSDADMFSCSKVHYSVWS